MVEVPQELEKRSLLLANLRAIGDGDGNTPAICRNAAEALQAAWDQLDGLQPEDGSVAAVKYRADDNGKSCIELIKALRKIKDDAEQALRMSWLST